MKYKFVRTLDDDVASKLKNHGFVELTEAGTVGYLFLLDRPLCFNENDIEIKKCQFTNSMFM